MSAAMHWMLRTGDDVAPTVLRLTLGLVMFPHGAQKALGWYGGPGPVATLQSFQDFMGIPPALTALVILAEFGGAIGLMTGLLTRLSALGIGIVMGVAVFVGHLSFGFFMNWSGAQKGEGFEYHVLAIGLALAILIRGGGGWSLDRLISRDRFAS